MVRCFLSLAGISRTFLLFCLVFGINFSAFAAQNTTSGASSAVMSPTTDAGKQAQKKPDLVIPLDIEFSGEDALGAELMLALKKQANGDSLFLLTLRDTPKIRLILSTVSEFPERPSVGSSYAVTWVFYEKPTVFTSYLDTAVGVVSPDTLQGVAVKLIAHTSVLAEKFPHLFE